MNARRAVLTVEARVLAGRMRQSLCAMGADRPEDPRLSPEEERFRRVQHLRTLTPEMAAAAWADLPNIMSRPVPKEWHMPLARMGRSPQMTIHVDKYADWCKRTGEAYGSHPVVGEWVTLRGPEAYRFGWVPPRTWRPDREAT